LEASIVPADYIVTLSIILKEKKEIIKKILRKQ